MEGTPAPLPITSMPDAAPPRVVALDDTSSLVIASVPARTYATEVLEPRLADLDWVAAAGAAHHAVIDAIADAGAVVMPFRLFTLFSSEAKAVSTLTEARAAIHRAFDRVRGKQEWVLRIGKPESSRVDADAGTPAAAPEATASGTSFLRAKAEAKRESAARAQRVKEDAAAACEALEQIADAVKTRSVDVQGNLLLDAAFLVPSSRVEAMRELLTRRAERLLRDGCLVSLTGPWPPSSFASMDTANE